SPVAKGVLTQIDVDALSLAPALVRRIISVVRRLFPRFLRYRALACGFPFWGASSPLRLSDDVDFKRLAIALCKEFDGRARVTGSSVILIHDFTARECRGLAAQLCNTGYLQASSLPDQVFPATFDSLQSWLVHLRPQYQQRWAQVMERFSSSGLQMRHTDGNAPISELFNSDVHHQHVTISKDWEVHFVDLPVDFFLKLSERCPDMVRWTFALDGDKVVGFVFGIMNQGRYYNMYLGHIPAYNESSELYSNLVLQDAGAALAENASEIRLGTEVRSGRKIVDFKADLGCTGRARYFFVSSRSILLRFLMRLFSRSLFPPPYEPKKRDVFTSPPGSGHCPE
ncbi:MAG: GNAT family N-acetyltransferase, partial [Xanthomonadales bacterium]|nr:GNAT family N-acetyltransferase [Xanthomonadales bacterium]